MINWTLQWIQNELPKRMLTSRTNGMNFRFLIEWTSKIHEVDTVKVNFSENPKWTSVWRVNFSENPSEFILNCKWIFFLDEVNFCFLNYTWIFFLNETNFFSFFAREFYLTCHHHVWKAVDNHVEKKFKRVYKQLSSSIF